MMVELKNEPGWTKAGSVKGILRAEDPRILIPDSIAAWSNIFPDSSAQNDGNGFQVSFSDEMLLDNYSFTVELLSGETEDHPYHATLDFDISLYLDQQGFPFYAENEVEASPVFLDIEKDGKKDIIFGDKSGNLYVVNAEGSVREGFPVHLGSQIGGIAVADIDRDDVPEIAVTLFDKAIHVYDINGNHEWSRRVDGFIPAMPAVGNLDDDPELEIVFGDFDQKLYVLEHDSSDAAAFPVSAGQNIRGGVALADLNGDGQGCHHFRRNRRGSEYRGCGRECAQWLAAKHLRIHQQRARRIYGRRS
ncbi:MAG: VCBS repeat-containing protein [Candidatus Marinimicrobia bacterium]|nr:VCBS repeat-containing protein [Candidatus Neomarinimicrobiota bacterium]